MIGLKLLRADGGSVTEKHRRVFYPVGEWVTVPGNGAYVALTGGLFSVGGEVVGTMECEEVVHVEVVPEGTVCFRRVRRLAGPPPADLLAECCRADPGAAVWAAAGGLVLPADLLAECCRAAPCTAVRAARDGLVLPADLLAECCRAAPDEALWTVGGLGLPADLLEECCRAAPGAAVWAAAGGLALPADLLAACCRAAPGAAVAAVKRGLALPTGILAECRCAAERSVR